MAEEIKGNSDVLKDLEERLSIIEGVLNDAVNAEEETTEEVKTDSMEAPSDVEDKPKKETPPEEDKEAKNVDSEEKEKPKEEIKEEPKEEVKEEKKAENEESDTDKDEQIKELKAQLEDKTKELEGLKSKMGKLAKRGFKLTNASSTAKPVSEMEEVFKSINF